MDQSSGHIRQFLQQTTGDLFRGAPVQSAQSTAAYVLSLILISSLVGRLLMGWLADRFEKKYVMLLIYLIVGCSIPLLFLASSQPFLYLFAVLFGIGLGGDYMIIPLMAAELFGVKVLEVNGSGVDGGWSGRSSCASHRC